MTTQRFQDIKRLFEAIVEVRRENRTASLEKLCGTDLDLRNEVASLLQEYDSLTSCNEFPAMGVRAASLLRRAFARHVESTPHSDPNPIMSIAARRTMSGRVISHYSIVQRIEEGGMGVVYKAQDSKLDRVVAVKFLASSLVADEDSRLRFVQEARAAAALNHPNICTVHEISEIDKDLFIVMEFVEGQDLAKRIASGPLAIREALLIAIQAGEGLQAAHERGIVHRDIKCSNIMVTPQIRVKILDFGLAQFDHVQFAANRSFLGTPAYMSPEQLEGTACADARTDIWSFGVVLYEMIAGRLPFQEHYLEALKYSIVHEDPAPLLSLRPEVPTEVDSVIKRALQKRPLDRYGSVQEMVLELGLLHSRLESAVHLLSEPDRPSFRSIAVLPFVNMSPDQGNEYFTDGLTDEIINALTQIRGLKVVSRGSAFAFKGTSWDIKQVSERLHVNAVVDGSVRVAGDRLRVTAQLVGVPDGYQIWSQRFDRAKADVFDLQDELTQRIVENLRIRLANKASEVIVKRYTNNLKAHECYLQGRFFLNKQTQSGARQAAHCFQQAIASSANYPLPYVGLADGYMLLIWYGLERPDKLIPKAKKAIEKALSLDEDLAAAHCTMGIIRAGYEWNWEEAERAFLCALALGPGFSTSHFHYAMDYLTPMGRLEEALKEIEMALQFDPLSLIVATAVGGCLYRQRNYDRAIESLEGTLAMDPTFYHGHWTLGKVFEQTNDFTKALVSLTRAKELEDSNPSILADLGHCYGKSGQEREALSALTCLDEIAHDQYVSPLSRAIVYLGLGQTEKTLEWLEKAYQDRARGLVWIGVDPRFDPLRSEAAFCDLTARIGLPAGPKALIRLGRPSRT